MMFWYDKTVLGIKREDPSTTGSTLANILFIEKTDDRRCIQIF